MLRGIFGRPLLSLCPLWAFSLIIFLNNNTIQAIPLGLSFAALPLILKAKLSYTAIGVFSICTYPYSLKLLWSPIVDSIYFKSFGRRKSWIIPTQLLNALLMLYLSSHVDNLLAASEVPINYLTLMFFLVTFLAATQDIAVDGWGLELFDEPDRHLCSQCQTVGIELGTFISYTIFTALNSADFCNNWLRASPSSVPIISVGEYLNLIAIIYFVVTVIIFFRREGPPVGAPHEEELTPSETYRRMWEIIQLPNIRVLLLLLLVAQVGIFAIRGVFDLRLASGGFPRSSLAASALMNFPLQLLTALSMSKLMDGKPLNLWFTAYKFQLALVVLSSLLVFFMPLPITWGFTISVFVVLACISVANTVRFTTMGAFFAAISDPKIGGTYLTLLNTVANFGGAWPKYFVLRLVDAATSSTCYVDGIARYDGCNTDPGACASEASKGVCIVNLDGYYPIIALCFVFGLALVPIIRSHLLPLQYSGRAASLHSDDSQLVTVV